MRTSISNANMCQPGADYVCDWKPLDNALHASSFPHLVFYVIYICEDEKTSLLELRENECNEICWVGRAVDLIRYIHIFFSLFFLSNANRVSFHLSFFSLLTGDSISLSSSFQLSKWTNQSPLTSLFFSSRAFTESFVFSRLGRFFFFFAFFFIVYSPMHQSIRSSFFSSLSLLFSMSPTSQQKKNSSERKRGGWTPQANPWIEKQKSNTHIHKEKKDEERIERKRIHFFPFICPVVFDAYHWRMREVDFFFICYQGKVKNVTRTNHLFFSCFTWTGENQSEIYLNMSLNTCCICFFFYLSWTEEESVVCLCKSVFGRWSCNDVSL